MHRLTKKDMTCGLALSDTVKRPQLYCAFGIRPACGRHVLSRILGRPRPSHSRSPHQETIKYQVRQDKSSVMFTRPAFHYPHKKTAPLSSPFHGHHPAGFRIPDRMKPKPCFNLFQGPNFTHTRSPAASPFSSPVKSGVHHPEDDPPPTLRLDDLFPVQEPKSPERRLASPPPKFFQKQKPPKAKKDALPTFLNTYPCTRKGKYGLKQLTMNPEAIRSSVLPAYRRRIISAKEKKRDRVRKRILTHYERLEDEARAEIIALRTEAERMMKDEDMDDEERIFVKQLRALQLDHAHKDHLCRIERAEMEGEERTTQYEERDRQAARLWVEEEDLRHQEEEKRRIAMLKCKMEEINRIEAELGRREEQERQRVEDERRRAHEELERQLREEQERQFREEQERKLQEEQARKAREERDRKLKEAHERFLREQRERIAREEHDRHARPREEEPRRTAQATPQDAHIMQQLSIYEQKWDELRNNKSLPIIDVSQLPWPVLATICSTPEQITYQGVRAFIFYPHRPSNEGKSPRDIVKAEILRFHPDKFTTRVVPKVQPYQQAVAQEIAGAVTRILTRIMSEVEKEN
ncbi:hypothetical protein HYDPIDRAFT_115948 [Hydnomerulius pinastri MD-312]|uniref:Uncharacterized protein n=1 Tax=Hydnomerulius pinastri MD-312 TaxID=994086 RepID=A0A0C9WC92_9AGAM|nr:hypothetical protein HYDPIDRAFT_115948 [Hydnomerulius pinastri MD-312]